MSKYYKIISATDEQTMTNKLEEFGLLENVDNGKKEILSKEFTKLGKYLINYDNYATGVEMVAFAVLRKVIENATLSDDYSPMALCDFIEEEMKTMSNQRCEGYVGDIEGDVALLATEKFSKKN
jgi:hypothetical protein